jgi:hypothetical protein
MVKIGLVIMVIFWTVFAQAWKIDSPCEEFSALAQLVEKEGTEQAPGVRGVELTYVTKTGLVITLRGGIGNERIGAMIESGTLKSQAPFSGKGAFYNTKTRVFEMVDFITDQRDTMTKTEACAWIANWLRMYWAAKAGSTI